MGISSATGSASGDLNFGERPRRRSKLLWRLGGPIAIPNGRVEPCTVTATPRNSGGWVVVAGKRAGSRHAVYSNSVQGHTNHLGPKFDIGIAMLHLQSE